MLEFLETCEECAEFVENGLPADSDTVKKWVNRAVQRLLRRGDWRDTMLKWRLFTKNNTLPCPRHVERILEVAIDGSPSRVYDMGYELIPHGPGDTGPMENSGGCKGLMDIGWSPLFFDIPWSIPSQLVCFSNAKEDVGQFVRIYGLDSVKNEIRDGSFNPGVELPINAWQGQVEGQVAGSDLVTGKITAGKYSDVIRAKKPATKGYISLYAIDPATFQFYFLAKWHPDDTHPLHRRYRITNPSWSRETSLLCWSKLRYVECTRDDDVMLIQDINAIVYEIMAMTEERAKNLTGAQGYKAMAINELQAETQNQRTEDRYMRMDECTPVSDNPSID